MLVLDECFKWYQMILSAKDIGQLVQRLLGWRLHGPTVGKTPRRPPERKCGWWLFKCVLNDFFPGFSLSDVVCLEVLSGLDGVLKVVFGGLKSGFVRKYEESGKKRLDMHTISENLQGSSTSLSSKAWPVNESWKTPKHRQTLHPSLTQTQRKCPNQKWKMVQN